MHMIPTFDSSFEFDSVTARLQALSKELVLRNPVREEFVRIPCDTVLSASEIDGAKILYIVREGCLHIRTGEKVVMMFEEGEVVIPPLSPLFLSAPDFSVAVDRIPITSVVSESGDLWREAGALFEFYSQLWLSVTAEVIRSAAHILPSTRVFSSGETIISQGDIASEVYTLIEGEADVFVDGVKVGEVQTNEFFGILASATRSPRTATVIARTNCAVLCVENEKFQELIRARPVLIEKLIGELSRMVVELNGKVVELSRPITAK